MKRKVWILNHHANNMYFDHGGRHYSIAKYLKKNGYEPVVFCSNSVHGKNSYYFDDIKIWKKCVAEEINVPFIFIKGRKYERNGIKRVLCMFDYYFNIKRAVNQFVQTSGKPDIIIASSAHPLTCVAGIQMAKTYKIKCIVEVRDLWPESIVAYDIATKKNPLIKLLYRLEKWIYTNADAIIFTMGGGKDYIIEQGWGTNQGGSVELSKVNHINNGVDLETFNFNKINYVINDSDLADKDIFKVVYTGSIRHANNVGMILDIAKSLRMLNVKFLLWGDGDEADALKKRQVDENIDNVVFKGRVDKEYIPYIVSNADINIMDMQNNNDIFRFGISPNKLFDYIAAKKPILMYQLNYYNPAVEYGLGFVAENFEEICGYIKSMVCKDGKYCIPKKESFENACSAFSYEKLAQKMSEIIQNI